MVTVEAVGVDLLDEIIHDARVAERAVRSRVAHLSTARHTSLPPQPPLRGHVALADNPSSIPALSLLRASSLLSRTLIRAAA